MNRQLKDASAASDVKKLKTVFQSNALTTLREWCRPVRRAIWLICLLDALLALSLLAVPLVTRELVDSAVSRSLDQLWRYGVMLALLIVLERVLSFLASLMRTKTAARFQQEMQRRIAAGIFSKEYAAVKPFHSGELVNRMFSDVAVIKEGVTEVLPSLLRTAISFVGAAVILTTMDWRFVPVMLICSVAWVGVTAVFRKPVKLRHKRMQEAEDELHATSQEMLENIRVLKASGSEYRALGQIDEHAEKLRETQIKNGMLSVFMKNGIGSVLDLSWLVCYIWGCVKIFRGEFSYGNLAAMIPLVGKIQSPVASAASLLGQVYSIIASTERLRDVLDLPDETDEGSLESFDRIVLDHVSFRYEDGTADVLTDFCGEITKGDFIALTGRSGEGKTTLFQLLLGIYRPTSGSVSFVQGDQTVPASKGIRHLFAYVPQGNTLLSGTLRENLTMFTDHASEAEILEAVRMACISDLVEEVGLDAVLGENGIGLSEGQAQRVAVARALLSKAPILLLDEATSALDEQTEALLLKNIATLRQSTSSPKTVLIVTHRPAALSLCPKHYLLRNREWNGRDGSFRSAER